MKIASLLNLSLCSYTRMSVCILVLIASVEIISVEYLL